MPELQPPEKKQIKHRREVGVSFVVEEFPMTIRILLADDHQVVRHGLRTALQREPGIEVLAEAENGRAAVSMVRNLQPDVVLMDIHMPDLNGTEACRQIMTEHPKVKVIALSMYSQKRYVLGMLEAGAAGFLLKNCSFDELVRAVRAVVSGKSYLSADIAGTVIDMAINPIKRLEEKTAAILTPREREVLQLIAEGHSGKAIADQLALSGRTVEHHRSQIIKKLNLKSIPQLTKFAIIEGLTGLDD
ncbi:MAG: response regulator transcription factor [Desulforhabdus sp.]|nr:response regulator transcription factor [Desulforhabdus sp.]